MVFEEGEGTPLALLMLALPRMLLLCKSKASAIKTSATRRKHPFSIRHIGKAANSHSICQCGISNLRPCAMPTDLSNSPSAASQLSCMETQAVGPPWSPCPPGTRCTPQLHRVCCQKSETSVLKNTVGVISLSSSWDCRGMDCWFNEAWPTFDKLWR